MRVLLVLPALALAALWALALLHWSDLPERFPVHFDLAGTPDRWAQRSAGAWFLLPILATVFVLGFAYALPVWVRRLAVADSPLLNVPHREAFSGLAPAVRVRALGPLFVTLQLLALEMALLFAALVHGSALVAHGTSARLPAMLVWPALALVLVTALASAPVGRRAIERELARPPDARQGASRSA